MPKSILQINKFEGGMVNYSDPRDIPENASADLVGLMTDTVGKIRVMGGASQHVLINENEVFPGSYFKPGYGLFAFNADHNLANNTVETKLLAIQSGKSFHIHDGSYLSNNNNYIHSNEIVLTTEDVSSVAEIQPLFYYVDGGLRVCDSNMNVNNDLIAAKLYKFVSKEWFPGTSSYVIPANWYDMCSYIFPPTTNQFGTLNLVGSGSGATGFAANSTSDSDGEGYAKSSPGSIMLEVVADSGTNGEFNGDTHLQFGASFIYDDGQESPISTFVDSNGAALRYDSTAAGSNHTLKFKISIGLGDRYDADTNAILSELSFDPRIAGVALYWVGDSLSTYEDPLYMAYCHFGSNDDDPAYFATHDGAKVSTFSSVDCTNGLTGLGRKSDYLFIKKIPALTYELRTGISNEEETTAARWSSAAIINRRAYVGGVQRIKFDATSLNNANTTGVDGNSVKQCNYTALDKQSDTMLISELNQFDIFPASNFIDVAINDGEKITALVSFADRILQFKDKNLYVINTSQDYEYLESQHKYMGVKHSYQVCETEFGIAWVNENGCFLYDGEQINNLITNKLNPTEIHVTNSPPWKSFIGNNGMIGYLQELKQLLILQDPVSEIATDALSENTSDVMIYDMRTGSWSRGFNKISGLPKSNLVMNYDDSCLYLSYASANSGENIKVDKTVNYEPGISAQWIITNIDGNYISFSSSKLSIGSTDITNTFSNTDMNAEESFRDFITRMIQQKLSALGLSEELSLDTNPGSSSYVITRPAHKITESDTFSGQDLTFTNNPTMTNISIAPNVSNRQCQVFACKGIDWEDEEIYDYTNHDPISDTGQELWGTWGELHGIPSNSQHTWVGITSINDATTESTTAGSGAIIPAGVTEYPWELIGVHCSIDMYFYDPQQYEGMSELMFGPDGQMWEGWHGTNQDIGDTTHSNSIFAGDGIEFFISNPFQNRGRCQIYVQEITGETSGNFSGADVFKLDTYFGCFDYWQQVQDIPWSPEEVAEWPGMWGPDLTYDGGISQNGYSWPTTITDTAGFAANSRTPMGYYSRAYLHLGALAGIFDGIQSSGMMVGFPETAFGWTLNVDGINGTGTQITVNNSGENNGDWQNLYTDANEKDFKWEVPSVVFRATSNKLVMTVLGDYSNELVVNQTYTLSGCSQSGNNKAFRINQIDVQTPFTTFQGGQCWSGDLVMDNISNYSNFGQYTELPSGDWGENAKLTVIEILKSDQSSISATFTNWNELCTYGDHNTITFTPGVTQMVVNNEFKTGTMPSGAQFVSHFYREGSIIPNVTYSFLTTGQNNVTLTETYETDLTDGDVSITNHFAVVLNGPPYIDTNGDGEGIYSAGPLLTHARHPQIPKYDYAGEASVTANVVTSGTGTIFSVVGDWGVNSGVAAQRHHIREGDVFCFSGYTGLSSEDTYYRVAIVGVFDGTVTPITIATTAGGSGGGTSGNTAVEIRFKDASAGNAADATYTGGFIKIVNSVLTRGLSTHDALRSLTHSGWIIEDLSVQQFQNSYNYTAGNTVIRYLSRDLDFGNPATTKAFYKVIITYKCTGGPIPIRASYNGSQMYTGLVGTGHLDDTPEWTTEELYLTATKSPKKAKSLQIQIGHKDLSSSCVNFELNDLSVVYREI